MTDQNNPLPFAFQPAPVNPAPKPLAKPPRKKRGRGPARPKAETAPKKPKRQYRARADRYLEPAAPVPDKTYIDPARRAGTDGRCDPGPDRNSRGHALSYGRAAYPHHQRAGVVVRMNLAIPPALDRTRLIGTYTMLNTYKNCPHQAARRYVVKDQPYVETPEMKWGNDVHSAFELRVGAKKPLPVSMQQWEQFCVPFDHLQVTTEQKLGIDQTGKTCGFFDNNVWFRGKVDLTIVNGTSAYIGDWKTGGSKYEDAFELATGALLLWAKFPDLKKIVGNYIWLKENRVGRMHDLSDFAATALEMKYLMGKIEQRRAIWRQNGDVDTFEKRKSGLCGYCSVADCEHHYVVERK